MRDVYLSKHQKVLVCLQWETGVGHTMRLYDIRAVKRSDYFDSNEWCKHNGVHAVPESKHASYGFALRTCNYYMFGFCVESDMLTMGYFMLS